MIESILEFLQKYWHVIASGVAAIVSLILAIISRYRKNRDLLTSVKESILDVLPEWISTAELLYSSGIDKKLFVEKLSMDLASSKGLSGKAFQFLVSWVDSHIESILDAPQKKGGLFYGKTQKD